MEGALHLPAHTRRSSPPPSVQQSIDAVALEALSASLDTRAQVVAAMSSKHVAGM